MHADSLNLFDSAMVLSSLIMTSMVTRATTFEFQSSVLSMPFHLLPFLGVFI